MGSIQEEDSQIILEVVFHKLFSFHYLFAEYYIIKLRWTGRKSFMKCSSLPSRRDFRAFFANEHWNWREPHQEEAYHLLGLSGQHPRFPRVLVVLTPHIQPIIISNYIMQPFWSTYSNILTISNHKGEYPTSQYFQHTITISDYFLF